MAKPVIFAHRGASTEAPENTIAAFRRAIELKADAIELDIRLTRDHHLVVIHDEKVDRTSNGRGLVSNLTLYQIKRLDFGLWFSSAYKDEKIPELSEVFELLKSWDGTLNIEIKDNKVSTIEALMTLIHAQGNPEQIILSSFHHNQLLQARKTDPQIRICLLTARRRICSSLYAAMLSAYSVHPDFSDVTQKVVSDFASHGIKVNAYTVNKPGQIDRLARIGVSGIITDFPKMALEQLNKE